MGPLLGAVVGGVAVASASESPEAGQGQSSGHDDLLRRSFDCKPPPIRGLTGAFPTLRHHHHTHREIGGSRREQRAACRRVGQEEKERRACGLVVDGHRVRRRSLRSIEARARGDRYVRQWGCGWLGREETRAEERRPPFCRIAPLGRYATLARACRPCPPPNYDRSNPTILIAHTETTLRRRSPHVNRIGVGAMAAGRR